jgi:UDP-N-acetyl-D-galactosamine dehydrogenase
VIDIYRELQSYGVQPLVHDPLANAGEVINEYQVELSSIDDLTDLHALILAVPHAKYQCLIQSGFGQMLSGDGVFIDIKACVSPDSLQGNIRYWSL